MSKTKTSLPHPQEFTPATDGIDHINIYSKSRSELGRLLSNFALVPFVCADGRFNSVEGYWYWLLCNLQPDAASDHRVDSLRALHGFQAKELGRAILGKDRQWRSPEVQSAFETKIFDALVAKTEVSTRIRDLLQESPLPFAHYYAYGDDKKGYKCIRSEGGDWLCRDWDLIRLAIQDSTSSSPP